jgi:leader peptidase (prepilin peptidase)/N-methyltransferase
MYPLIELSTGLLFVAAYLDFGISQALVKWLFFTCLVIVLTITDLRVRMLPDVINWPGFAAGLLFSAFVPPNDGIARFLGNRFFQIRLPEAAAGILDGLIGAAFGSFLLLGLAKAYKATRGREGMGMGDVKMMAMVGAFLGLRGTFLAILVGSLFGSVIGLSVVLALFLGGWRGALARRASQRGLGTERGLRWTLASQYQLPLGTFLGIGALVVVYATPMVAARWPIFRWITG